MGTGPYWEVVSTGRHFRGSGWAETPPSESMHLTSDRDVPYMFFGCRNSRTQRCCDGGIFTLRSRGVWDMFLFPNDSDRPGHGWLEKPIARPWGSAVYLIFDVVPNGVRLTAIDARTWRPLGTLQQSFGADWGFHPGDPDLRIYRCVTIGQRVEDLASGSWIRDAHWHNVYLYRSSGYGPWTARWTSSVAQHPTARTGDEAGSGPRVEVRIPAGRRYFEDYVDIHLEG